jgi:hypothetical protein
LRFHRLRQQQEMMVVQLVCFDSLAENSALSFDKCFGTFVLFKKLFVC